MRTLADDEVASSGEEIALDSEEDNVSDAVPGKDEIEQELERLVFGDATGFKDEIKGFKNALAYGHDVDEEVKKDNEDDQLAEIDDADVSLIKSPIVQDLLPTPTPNSCSFSTLEYQMRKTKQLRTLILLETTMTLFPFETHRHGRIVTMTGRWFRSCLSLD